MANENGWSRAKDFERRNPDRTVYRDPKTGDLYSVDTHHGTFERTNKRGKDLGESDIDGNLNVEKQDASGGHGLKVK